jgi:hypothetical protein
VESWCTSLLLLRFFLLLLHLPPSLPPLLTFISFLPSPSLSFICSSIRLANGSVHTIDFREWAPLHSTSAMFVGHPNASTFGPLAIAVPAELAGLEKAHNLYGKAKWKDLVQPAIDLATSSYVSLTSFLIVSPHSPSYPIPNTLFYSSSSSSLSSSPLHPPLRRTLFLFLLLFTFLFLFLFLFPLHFLQPLSQVGAQLAKTLVSNEADIDRWGNKEFKKIYKPDGVLLKEGDIFKQPKLAATLQTIATQGASAFYQGTIADQIAQEVQKAGGILTSEVLSSFSPVFLFLSCY